MGRKRKKKPLPPRCKRMKRAGRLQSAKAWLQKYTGKNVLRGYCNHFAVDWRCAAIELKQLGVHLDPKYLKQREVTEEQLSISRKKRAQVQSEADQSESWYEYEYGSPWEAYLAEDYAAMHDMQIRQQNLFDKDTARNTGLVTNIKDIERLATEKEDQNWRFRCSLKGCDLEIEELDAIVHRLNDKVSAEIDCQSCGNCCRVMHPVLKAKDIKRLAVHLSITPSDFEKEYLEKDDNEFIFRSEPCPFLSGNSCTVYTARPEDCRSYPHLHKKHIVFRLNGVVNNCSCCPIVYNVYELLKDELGDLQSESYVDDYEYE